MLHPDARLGIMRALALPAWLVGFSLVSVGSLARDVGHPVGAAVLSTVLIWAGPAQILVYGGLAAGAAPLAVAIAVCLSSVRFLPMTMALLPYLRRPGQPQAELYVAAHLTSMTSWLEGMHRLPDLEPERRYRYYLAFSTTCMVVASATTAAGYYLVGALPSSFAAGLLMLTPIFFMISLCGGARNASDWVALGLGAALEPVSAWAVGRDFDLLSTGLIGGTLAYWVGRRARLHGG